MAVAIHYEFSVLERSMKPIYYGWQYWARLVLTTILSLLVASAGTIIWVSYQQTMSYLHPVRHTASGALLQVNGIFGHMGKAEENSRRLDIMKRLTQKPHLILRSPSLVLNTSARGAAQWAL